MDDKTDLIRQHRRAAREYSNAVAKLRTMVGNHERFAALQRDLVEPARKRCHLLYARWWELYHLGEPGSIARERPKTKGSQARRKRTSR